MALNRGDLRLAEECADSSGDMAGLLLLYTSTGDADGVDKLATRARALGKNNVAFVALFLLNRVEDCIDLLMETGRIPEAAFMARTYMPSLMGPIVVKWREDLAKVSERAAQALANPDDYPNLFPDLEWALKVEAYFKQHRSLQPASNYPNAINDLELDLIALFKQNAADQPPAPPQETTTPAQTPAAEDQPVQAQDQEKQDAEDAARKQAEEELARKEAEEQAAAEQAKKAQEQAELEAAKAAKEAEEKKIAQAKAEKEAAEKAAAEKAAAEKAAAEKAEADEKKRQEEEAAKTAAQEADDLLKEADDILNDDDDLGEDW